MYIWRGGPSFTRCAQFMPPASSVDPKCEWLLRRTILPYIRAMWRPELVDEENFPEGPCFIYGNHAHNLDPFMLNLFTAWGNSTSGVLTMEHMRKGPLAYLLRGIGLLATRKAVPEPHLIRKIYQRLDEGRMVVIYPEGGRRWDGRPKPWVASTAKLFARCGVPVYPVITEGSYVAGPRWARFSRPARIRIRCLEPLHFPRKTPVEKVLPELAAAIDIDENIVPDDVKPRWAFRPADGIERLLYRDPATGQSGGIYTPDGTTVVNSAGTLHLKMCPDSTLLDERSGEVHTTGDLYERISNLPLTPQADGSLVRNQVDLHTETLGDLNAPLNLTPHGRVEAALFADSLRIHGLGTNLSIGLEDIRFTGIERNYKLQLTLDDRMIQLSFVQGGSALQWSDTLRRLMKIEESTSLSMDKPK